ncbi:MAG: hypothetical protein ACI4KM_03280 [Oscillospiraceae bacterium]
MVEFDAALRYIDMGNYDKAIEHLKLAIDKAAETDEAESIKYRCVLGELYANLEMTEEAKSEFNRVVVFTNENTILAQQRHIAQTFLRAYEAAEQMPADELTPAKRPGDVPLVPKPVQDKGFIAKQMSKRRK